MADNQEDVLRENLYEAAHDGLRHRQHNVQNRNNVNPTTFNKENEIYLRIYKYCIFVGYSLLLVTMVIALILGYFFHQKTLELEICNNGRTHRMSQQHKSLNKADSSLCQVELEKWQKLFHSERGSGKDMVDRIVSDAETYMNTKTDLEVCRTSYWYTLTALIVTWGTLVCIVMTVCYCRCCMVRQDRYSEHRQLVVYER